MRRGHRSCSIAEASMSPCAWRRCCESVFPVSATSRESRDLWYHELVKDTVPRPPTARSSNETTRSHGMAVIRRIRRRCMSVKTCRTTRTRTVRTIRTRCSYKKVVRVMTPKKTETKTTSKRSQVERSSLRPSWPHGVQRKRQTSAAFSGASSPRRVRENPRRHQAARRKAGILRTQA